MANMLSCCITPMLQKTVMLAGMQQKKVEIEPAGTVINFWVPSKPSRNPKIPLVLLHGFAADGILTWACQVLSSSLRKKYSIYVADLVFFGGSYTSSEERSTRFQGDCIAAGLGKLGVDKCVLVGFSYGGLVGFQMAEHHPELVRAVVAMGSVPALTQSISSKTLEEIGFSSWAEFLLPTSPQGVKVLFKAASFNLPLWMFPSFLYKNYLEVMFSNRKEREELLKDLVIRDEDVTPHQFQQRIHLLWGTEDKLLNMELANNLKEKLGGETMLVTVKKAGHLAMLERPFTVNKRLKQILSSLAAKQT